MPNTTLSERRIPQESLILVTGVNSLVASHVADQFLAAGYRVRGTVRDVVKCSWLEVLFVEQYGPGRFELVQVPDVAAPGAWGSAIEGVVGVAHVLSAVDGFATQDCDRSAQAEMVWQASLLEAAAHEPTVKAFVMTSSAWAAWTAKANSPAKVTEWSWNTEAVELARTDKAPLEKGLAPWMALKVLVEQGCWGWVDRERERGMLPFAFNTVLLDTVIGDCLHPSELGVPSTAGMVEWVYAGSRLDDLALMEPQWYINTRDSALLFVAAMVTPGVDGERLYGCGARYSWPRVSQILRELYPKEKLPVLEDNGSDQTEVPNQRAEELLRTIKEEGWTSLEESVKMASECFLRPGEARS